MYLLEFSEYGPQKSDAALGRALREQAEKLLYAEDDAQADTAAVTDPPREGRT
jgi:hypothetical protein